MLFISQDPGQDRAGSKWMYCTERKVNLILDSQQPEPVPRNLHGGLQEFRNKSKQSSSIQEENAIQM